MNPVQGGGGGGGGKEGGAGGRAAMSQPPEGYKNKFNKDTNRYEFVLKTAASSTQEGGVGRKVVREGGAYEGGAERGGALSFL